MARKTTSKNANSTTKTAAKSEPKAPAKKAASPAKAEAKQKDAEKKQAPEVAAAPEPKAASDRAEPTKAPKTAPRPRDPRLPAPGTVIQKKDRQGNVRCECTVEEDGIRYKGTLYRSLSAAAMAASKDLGIGGRATNGYLFFGLIKQPARETDAVAALEHAWEHYRARDKSIMAGELDAETSRRVQDALKKHSGELASIS